MTLDPGIAVAVVTAIAALIAALSGRRKTDAEIAKSDAEMRRVSNEIALSLITPLKAQITELQGEVATLRMRVAEFRRGVRILCGQVRQLGAEPLWEPPVEDWDEY